MTRNGARVVHMAIGYLLVSAVAVLAAGAGRGDELAERRRWVAAKIGGETPPSTDVAGLTVLANHDPVQQDGRGGRPMQMAGQTYRRGLYCHAVSRVIVHLAGPGKTFAAAIGVDSNEQTSGGRGSVVFAVEVNGKSAFRSKLMREGTAAEDVSVDLGGAREFTLMVEDGGDGNACDQSDWADARVILADGTTTWLGELPIINGEVRAYSTEPPFSFVYDGKPSGDFLAKWKKQSFGKPLDEVRTQYETTYTDPATGLVLRSVAIEYKDFPTVEWTLYFKNNGTADTPILSDIQPLDLAIPRAGAAEFTLHHFAGSPCLPTDYQPFATVLGPKTDTRISTNGGRPTNSDLPYFNIEQGRQGVMAVIGWPGQWAARFVRDEGNMLRVTGGQELTHFKLHAGEEVRTPLVVLQFWKGDRFHAHNVWRRWMREHNLPRPGSKPLAPQTAACSSHQFAEMINANEANQKFFVDRYVEERLHLDYWWMDAGWYPCSGWPNTGTWEVDTQRFPGGLRAISDHAKTKGIRTIVWFEPERVTPGSWLWKNHQEWLLGPKGDVGPDKLLDLGNPQAWTWLANHVDKLITEQGIDLYRQDFNTDPLDRWRMTDAPDRQGITEIRYVTGYLAYWDELLKRHPGMLIDSCASGGRRNDLETMRRGVPLLRSDFLLEPVSQQNHTYGMSFWYPFYGTGMTRAGLYDARSCICPHVTLCYDMRDAKYDYELARRVARECHIIGAYMLDGDYYPLTAYSPANDVWMGWQFDEPEKGEGVVQVFRRADCIYSAADLRLNGLNPDKQYTVRSLDGGTPAQVAGRTLMEQGLEVKFASAPGSAVFLYQMVK